MQHSWLWDLATSELIETTAPAKKYFGVALNDQQALKFAWQNVPEFKDPAKQPARLSDLWLNLHFREFTKTSDYTQGFYRLFNDWLSKRIGQTSLSEPPANALHSVEDKVIPSVNQKCGH